MAPAADGPQRKPPYRTKRWRAERLVIAAAVVLAACVVAVAAWVANYQPISAGGAVSTTGFAAETGGQPPNYIARWTEGGGFVIGTQLVNDGRFAVTVRSIDLPSRDIDPPWDNWRITMSTGDRDSTPTLGQSPLAPFTLEPGEHRWIWIRGDFEVCPTPFVVGGRIGFAAVDVAFETFGFGRQDVVPLGFMYSVELTEPCS